LPRDRQRRGRGDPDVVDQAATGIGIVRGVRRQTVLRLTSSPEHIDIRVTVGGKQVLVDRAIGIFDRTRAPSRIVGVVGSLVLERIVRQEQMQRLQRAVTVVVVFLYLHVIGGHHAIREDLRVDPAEGVVAEGH
jgi:hypothetical protein